MDNLDELIINQAVPEAGAEELLRLGEGLFMKGMYQQAMLHFMAAVRQRPDLAEAHHRMGMSCREFQQWESAQFSFEKAIRLKPDDAASHRELGRLLLVLGRIEPATHHARRAVELAPGDAEAATALADLLDADRQSAAAWEIVNRLLRSGYESTPLLLLHARMAPAQKRDADALARILRRLRRGQFNSSSEQASLHFAAAGLLDLMRRYDEAFAHASRANKARGRIYDAEKMEWVVRTWIEYFTPDKLSRLPRATNGSDTPVFIVGVPRSGTSLVEQILASHPQVHGAGELTWIFGLWETLVKQHAGTAASLAECLDRLTPDDVNALAGEYLTRLAALSPAAARITDKMPMNLTNLGLISMLFPRCRVIYCHRDPMDTCLSSFMTDFSSAHEYSGDPVSAGHHTRQCERLMSHWKSVLDIPILQVEYEDVVGDVEGQARRMLEFLDLPWDERCLRFYDNKRFVSTASNGRVRLPIYDQAVGRWRNYEKHLAPLRTALSPQPPIIDRA